MDRPFPSTRAQILHVLTLSAFAVAQPLFDLLGRNASFFVAHRASRLDVSVLTFVVLFGAPAVLIAARFLVGAISEEAGRTAHVVIVGLLVALAIGAPGVRAMSLHRFAAATLLVVITALAGLAYRRAAGVRRFVTILSPAVLVFAVLFIGGSQMRDVVFAPASARTVTTDATSDVPVLAVLFDELSIASLITPDGDIDADLFPGFARLARMSTWYREATTSGLRTDQAVPAVLTGRRVPTRQVPSAYAYPDNVFELLRHSHDMHVHEFVTQLCPPDLCQVEGAEQVSGFGSLFADTVVVYGHLVLPSDLATRWLPPLGDRWAGFSRDAPGGGGNGGDPVRDWLRAAIDERETQHEGAVFERFMREVVDDGTKPQFSWMHVQLPHPPWRYLPDGTTYPAGDTTPGYKNFRWSADQYLATEVLQRSLLQTRFADVLVGRMLDRLEESGQLDDLMLIVLSDHGATWEAERTRRDVDGPQAAGLLGVPLFVKYPGQQQASTDDRPAEVVDVVPTVADVTGVDLPWSVHGFSLRSNRHHRDRRVFDGSTERIVDYTFADARRRSREIFATFSDDLLAFGPDRDLIGRSLIQLDVEEISVSFDREAYADVDTKAGSLPAFFRARVNDDLDAGVAIAVVVNEAIAGVGQTYIEDGATRVAVMLDPSLFIDGRNVVEVVRVNR